jgi:carboxypeptidase Taq
MSEAYDQLKAHFHQAHILDRIQALLTWDERVMMPPESGSERTNMKRILSNLKFSTYLSSEIIKPLLAQAQHDMHTLSPWDQQNLRYMIGSYDDPPLDIVPNLRQDLRDTESRCRQIWPVARANHNWDMITPTFTRLVYLRRILQTELATVRNEACAYDTALSHYSRNLRTHHFDTVIETIVPPLRDFIAQSTQPIGHHPVVAPIALPAPQQLQIMHEIIRDMGFDFMHGRLDTSTKAFFEKTDDDRRIVTTIDPAHFMGGLSSAIHETGHALHYQYLPEEWVSQPVGRAGDYCMREAMAFIWQIFVAQTPSFNIYLARKLQNIANLHVDPANLDLMQNIITPSPVRIGSDAASYVLHILIRYQIERDLINGVQDVANLPQRWAQDYQTYFNITLTPDSPGVLQDIHWYKGSFGYFPCYALAMLYAAQLFHKAKQDIPDLVQGFAQGSFAPLVQWLRDKIYSQANFHDGLSLLEQATGEKLNPQYFMDYLQTRYKVEPKTA